MFVPFKLCVYILGLLQVVGGCPNFWTTFEDSCYAVLETTATWAGAAELCERFDSRLATVESSRESEFLRSFLVTKKLQVPHVWIGGNDLLSEGHWMWEDSQTAMTYTDWCPGEPDDAGSQDCVSLSHAKGPTFNCSWQFDDESCDFKYNVLCEQVDRSIDVTG